MTGISLTITNGRRFAFPLLLGGRPKVRVTNPATGKAVECSIVDVGPWNTNDPYWETNGRPQAESGTDMSGRRTNLAGIDLTPGAAVALGIAGKGKIDWEFVASTAAAPQAAAGLASQPQMIPLLVTLLQALAKNGGRKMPIPAEDVSALLQQISQASFSRTGCADTGCCANPSACERS